MAELTPLQQSFQQKLKLTRITTADNARRAWNSLDTYAEKDLELLTARVNPIVQAGQKKAASLTSAYLTKSIGGDWNTPQVDPDEILGEVRGGLEPRTLYKRSLRTVWEALREDVPLDEAIMRGGNRLWAAAGMNVLLAFTAAAVMFGELNNHENSNSSDKENKIIIGWTRVSDPSCCDFCATIDGAFVYAEDSLPLHNNCSCTLEPVMGTDTQLKEMLDKREKSEGNRITWVDSKMDPETENLMNRMLAANSVNVPLTIKGELGPYIGK
jgi:hypothetical protein